jgi:integrase
MPKKASGRGTFPIDRIVPHVGRIKKASGAKTRVEFNRRNRMISELIERGYLDVLEDIRDGHVSVTQVYATVQKLGYEALAKRDVMKPLTPSLEDWIRQYDCSDDYRRALGTTARYVERFAPGASVNDLSRIVTRLKVQLPAPSFNRTRAHLSSFATQTLGLNHAIAVEIRSVKKKAERVQRRPMRLTPSQMAEFFPAPITNPVDAIAWSMATTGMGLKELWGEWELAPERIHVHGTKRAARERVVPRVSNPSPPMIHRSTFAVRFRERMGERLVPYQLRGTFAHWMEEAQVGRSRRRIYLGHGSQDTTALYERHEVTEFLQKDSQLFRTYLAASLDQHTPEEVQRFLGWSPTQSPTTTE